jgi:hypothetical protein
MGAFGKCNTLLQKMHTVAARPQGDRRPIGENFRSWAMKRPAGPVAVVQIPREEEWKFDNKRDAKFCALSTARLAL